MNLRPKTKKRLAILLAAGTVGIAAASTLYLFGLNRYERGRLAYRALAMSAFQHGDYHTAAADFSSYLSNDRVDPEAIYALALCRMKLPRPDLGNLLDARKLFTRYLELRPGDLDAQHQLLDIYQKTGSPAETMTIAASLLTRNPDDVAALSAQLHQLDRDMNFSDALPISLRLNELTPLDVRTQTTTLSLMARMRKPQAEIVGRADRLLAAHPNDPRFQLVRAVAAFFIDDVDGTRKWLHTAAAGTPPDADFIILLADVFDKLNMWDESRSLLEKAAAVPNSADEIRATLVQRLFELDRYDAALAVLKNLNPQDPASDSRLLGLYGLILINHDHPSAEHPSQILNAIIATLQKRDEDVLAVAWYSLLKAIIDPSPVDPLASVRLCQTAGRLDPDNADARFYLAMEYEQLGESELSLQFYRQAIQLQPEWATPCTMIARILTQRGQAGQATTMLRPRAIEIPIPLPLRLPAPWRATLRYVPARLPPTLLHC